MYMQDAYEQHPQVKFNRFTGVLTRLGLIPGSLSEVDEWRCNVDEPFVASTLKISIPSLYAEGEEWL